MLQYDNLHVRLNDAYQFDKSNPPKSITVTFGLSASAKKINDRIYTPVGQQEGLQSWVKPYAKPILVFHDQMRDAIGRLINVEFVDNSAEAIKFFRSTADFIRFRNEILSNDPERMYQAMVDYELLNNEEWPGLSTLRAKARITDAGAIEKFIDERYLNFSGGSDTDRYVCSACLSDWKNGDYCEHTPGQVTEDGKQVVFITGAFKGREVSVVNEPAYKGAMVHAIEFTDSMSSINKDSFQLKVMEIEGSLETEVDLREEIIALVDDQANRYSSKLVSIEDKLIARVEDLLKPKQVEVIVSDEFIKDDQIDWGLLDLALKALVVNPLTADNLKDSDVNCFCTEDRHLPIVNNAYAIAARDLITTSKLADAQKTQILYLIDKKAARLSTSLVDKIEYENLKKDYENSLVLVDELRAEIVNLKEALDTASNATQNTSTGTIDNPSIRGGEENSTTLGDFERQIVSRYKDIQSKEGKGKADMYILAQKRKGYISAKFNIDTFIKEN